MLAAKRGDFQLDLAGRLLVLISDHRQLSDVMFLRVAPCLVGAMLLLLGMPKAIQGQDVHACRAGAAGGVRFVEGEVLVGTNDPPRSMGTSAVLGLRGFCTLASGVEAGLGLDVSLGESIRLYDIFAAARVEPISPRTDESGVVVAVTAQAGLTLTSVGSHVATSELIRTAEFIDPGESNGPLLGLALELGQQVGSGIEIVVSGGLRTAFLEFTRTDADGETVSTWRAPTHSFPIVLGVRVEL